MADDPAVSAPNTRPPIAPTASAGPARADPWRPTAPRLPLVPQLRERLLDRTAAWLSARGVRRIALYPGGRHTRAILRQPWLMHGIEVSAVLDDTPKASAVAGVPVWTPAEAARSPAFQAVVLSTTEHEEALGQRARAAFADTAVEVVGLYLPDDELWEAQATMERLVARGVPLADARWLVDHRGERHDALLPIIPPARTELHARRYELAAAVALEHGAARVADIACGTGYGVRLLAMISGARAEGVDLDPAAVDYARRTHGLDGRCVFHAADACRTPLPSASFDVAASFETIEHVRDASGLVAELHRVLAPGGRLVMSTPNRLGPTPYHVHDFGFPEFAAMVAGGFEVERWIGQSATDEVFSPDLPPGMWPLDKAAAMHDRWPTGPGRPQFLIAQARKGASERPARAGHVEAIVSWLRSGPPAGV